MPPTDLLSLLQGRVATLRPCAEASGKSVAPGSIGRRLDAVADPTHSAVNTDCRVLLDGDREATVPASALADLGLAGAPSGPRSLAIGFCAVVGSKAQGLEHGESDTDRRGFFVPSARLHFSLEGSPNQIVHDSDQLCFWEIGRFVRLALKANPTVLETLFSPRVEIASAWAQRLLSIREAFLSRRAHQTFTGYAESQFAKMQRARDRGDALKHRHAMHLIRLLRVGAELGRTGRLDVVVPVSQREELLAIKRGERPWHEIEDLHQHLARECDEAFAASPLPEYPDTAAAEAFLIDLRLAVARDKQ